MKTKINKKYLPDKIKIGLLIFRKNENGKYSFYLKNGNNKLFLSSVKKKEVSFEQIPFVVKGVNERAILSLGALHRTNPIEYKVEIQDNNTVELVEIIMNRDKVEKIGIRLSSDHNIFYCERVSFCVFAYLSSNNNILYVGRRSYLENLNRIAK